MSADFSADMKVPMPRGGFRKEKVFNLPRDLTETLITGYNAPLRLVVVRRLREQEDANAKPVPTLTDAATLRGLLLGHTEQVLKLEHRIAEDPPKVEFYHDVAVSVGTQSVQDVAKEFGMGSIKSYKLLRDEKS
ncbi:phage antirepressor KilAC domain-containing protein [Pseudomonas sp. NPDC090203]|uniref:phage antirepressor KilAC domain-containing protein n=1 Tax=Pseudomonas sp. NPDC090203 TaxID=3364477 RepID=UPI003830F5F9